MRWIRRFALNGILRRCARASDGGPTGHGRDIMTTENVMEKIDGIRSLLNELRGHL